MLAYQLGVGLPQKNMSTDFCYNDNWGVKTNTRVISDVNGDGKGDIIGFGDNSVYVSLSTGSGFASKTAWISDFTRNNGWGLDKEVINGNGDTTDVEKYPRIISDVNGDGKKDIIGFGDSSVYTTISNY